MAKYRLICIHPDGLMEGIQYYGTPALMAYVFWGNEGVQMIGCIRVLEGGHTGKAIASAYLLSQSGN